MAGTALRLREIEQSELSPLTKGLPGDAGPIPLAALGAQGWNLLKEDLSLPVAVVKDSAIDRNRAWMRAFLQKSGARLAPHGKTAMAPQILQMQLDDGAWAITAATANQIAVYRHFGVPRILLANQLMGRRNLDFVLGELRRDPSFDFYCLVDSLAGLRLLEAAARRADIGRPLQLLLEVGALDGRTGLRDKSAALEVARAVGRAAPYLTLRGVEGYEGVFRNLGQEAHEESVLAYFAAMLEVLEACRMERLFAEGPILLTAGGSDFYDFAVRSLGPAALEKEILLVLRSGCYITQDNLHYDRAFARILERSPELRGLAPPMAPALEVWGYLQSLPEPGLGFATLGKRDISYDFEMPKPLAYYRPGDPGPPLPIPEGHAVLRLNDQHAHLKLPPESPLRVGDMLSFGVSHPCTTFDKWQLLLRVDDAYNVTGALRTFF